jgi:putative colanic acid biosynthesis acetyltransferase WcaF
MHRDIPQQPPIMQPREPHAADPVPDDPTAFYPAAYRSELSLGNKLARAVWAVVHLLLFRFSPVPCHGWRRLLLRAFGGRIARTAKVYPSARIWAPWNLTMEPGAVVGPEVYCYSVGPIVLGVDSTTSFRAFLCTASHDIHDPARPLVTGPIRIERGAYIFADAFIGMNVTVGEAAVVAARAVVVRDIAAYDVVAGNPARVVGRRRLPGGDV